MQQAKLVLQLMTATGHWRTMMKTTHGRHIYLELQIKDNQCSIVACFYADRNRGKESPQRYAAIPANWQTKHFAYSEERLLDIISVELDRCYYGVVFEKDLQAEGLSRDEFINYQLSIIDSKYRFLVMLGTGEQVDGLPAKLCTRLKNRLHREIFLEITYYESGRGLVKACYYCDRQYKQQECKVSPYQWRVCFVPFDRAGILKFVNEQLNCAFTNLLVADDGSLDIVLDKRPLCGYL